LRGERRGEKTAVFLKPARALLRELSEQAAKKFCGFNGHKIFLILAVKKGAKFFGRVAKILARILVLV